jgi:CBS domain-containing protein
MDGGRVLRSLLAMRMEYARATRIAARIGQGMAALFGFIGLFGNPMLLLIALFVWIGAGQEAAAVEMKSSFSGVRVREAMLTDFRTLSPRETVGEAARLLLAGSQQNFPVVENGRVVGVLTHVRIFEALQGRSADTLVTEVMERVVQTAAPEEELDAALTRVEPGRATPLPVMQNGQLIGLLTAENLGEFYMIRRALAARGKNRPPAPPLIGPARVVPPPILARQSGA